MINVFQEENWSYWTKFWRHLKKNLWRVDFILGLFLGGMGLGVFWVVLLFLFWFGLFVVEFLKFFLLLFFLMLNETLAGKIPHETSQAIHPGFYVLSKYMDPACAAACCQVHYILSIHAPEWFLLKPLSFIVGDVRLCREQLILTEVGVELPDWLSTEDNRHWVTLQGRRIQQTVGFVFLWSISFTFLDNMCFVLSLFHIINWQWLRIQFFFSFCFSCVPRNWREKRCCVFQAKPGCPLQKSWCVLLHPVLNHLEVPSQTITPRCFTFSNRELRGWTFGVHLS